MAGGTVTLERLPKGADLVEAVLEVALRHNLTHGAVKVIGALQCAVLGYYNQKAMKYESIDVVEEVEIVSGLGNISIKDDQPFVHLHLVLSKQDGVCLGGHAMPGTVIFAAEAMLQAGAGDAPHRKFDPDTGLYLWS